MNVLVLRSCPGLCRENNYPMRILYFILFVAGFPLSTHAQKVLQIEKYGTPRSEKIYIGDEITYRLKGEENWHSGYIVDLIVEREVIALEDRYVDMEDIDALRYRRGWTTPVGISLLTFGLAWSGFALIGTATDGDPTTSYRASDAVVSAVSIGMGLVVGKLLKNKTIRFGNKRRLRMLDLSFK